MTKLRNNMKKTKPKNYYTPPEDPIKMMPKPDPDAKPFKKKYKFERGPRHNFWSLFEETK
jgi:hypothetical protein